MNESPNKRAVVVGLFVLVGLLFLVAGILTIGNLHETFKRKMRVVSLFDDVNGLLPGSNIWFSGVKVGTVHDVNVYGSSQVEVTLNVDRSVQQYIHKDSKVKISTDGLIGNKIIVIFGGTHESGVIEEGDTLRVQKMISTEEMMATFQESNKNLLSITSDFKIISKKILNGQGTVGKFLSDESIYNNIKAMSSSLQKASNQAQVMMASVSEFTSKLNDKGTLANDIVTDTVVFNSIKASVSQIQLIADSASVFVDNLKRASSDPKSPIGVMLHDEQTGINLKETIRNLDSSSAKLNRDLEALEYSFFLRGAFKREAKSKLKSK